MMYLKQSTAATVVLGPFLDSTNGVDAETGLTISQADVRLSKNAGTFAQKNDTNAATHMENGYYSCQLDATDTNTLGRLNAAVAETGALPVWHEFTVLAANVFDALIGGGDLLDVQVAGMDAGTVTAAAVATGAIDADAIAADAIQATKVQDGTITAAKFATGAIDAAALNTDAVNEIVDQVWDEAMADHVADGSFGLASQVLRANTATAGGATSITLDAGAPTTANLFNGARILIVGGTGAGQQRVCTSYTSGQVANITPAWAVNPNATSKFVILGGSTNVAAWRLSQPSVLNAGRVDGVAKLVDASAITTGSFTAGAINAAAIATDAIQATKIQDGAITAAKIATAAITAAKFGTGAVDAQALATDAANEIRDAILDATQAQPGQEAPAATQSIKLILAYLYKAWRNKTTQDSTDYKLFDDAGTQVDHQAPASESAGTVTRDKVVAGT